MPHPSSCGCAQSESYRAGQRHESEFWGFFWKIFSASAGPGRSWTLADRSHADFRAGGQGSGGIKLYGPVSGIIVFGRKYCAHAVRNGLHFAECLLPAGVLPSVYTLSCNRHDYKKRDRVHPVDAGAGRFSDGVCMGRDSHYISDRQSSVGLTGKNILSNGMKLY